MKENRETIISKCRSSRCLEDGQSERAGSRQTLSSRALTAQTPSDGDGTRRTPRGRGDLAAVCSDGAGRLPASSPSSPMPVQKGLHSRGKPAPLQRDRGDCCDQVLLTLRRAVFHSSICSSLPPRPRGWRQAPLLLVPKYDLAIFITHPQLTGNCPIWELDLEENKAVLKT